MLHPRPWLKLCTLPLLGVLACGGTAPAPNTPESVPAASETPAAAEDTPAGDSPTPTVESAPSSEKATLVLPGPVKGFRLMDHRTLNLEFSLNLQKNGQGVGIDTRSWSLTEERTLRARNVGKAEITELELVYGKWEAAALLDQSFTPPTNGQSYLVVGNGDGGVKITRANGQPPSTEESTAVSDEYGWVGTPSPLRVALAEVGLEAGRKIPSSAAIALALYGTIPGVDPKNSTANLTLHSVEQGKNPSVRADVQGSVRIRSHKTVFDVELAGTAQIDTGTGLVRGLDLKGTIVPSGQITHPKKGALDVSGKGKLTLKQTSELL